MHEPLAGHIGAIGVRVKFEFPQANAFEALPTAALTTLLKRLGRAYPKEKISNGISNRKLIKIIRLQPTAAKSLNRNVRQQRQCAQHCSAGSLVLSDIKAESIV
jgi:hypothetical protein